MLVCGGCKVGMKRVGRDIYVFCEGVRSDRVLVVDEYLCRLCGAVVWWKKSVMEVDKGKEEWWRDRCRYVVDGRGLLEVEE